MAAVYDLLGRAAALDASVTYNGNPPAWLLAAAKVAAQGCAVIVNTKGVRPDDTPCIVTLAELERLRAAAAAARGRNVVASAGQLDGAFLAALQRLQLLKNVEDSGAQESTWAPGITSSNAESHTPEPTHNAQISEPKTGGK